MIRHLQVEERIRLSGIRNYSIFLQGDQLLAYFEYVGDDWAADTAAMAAHPATQRWWALTDPCQEPLPEAGAGSPWTDAREVWHLS